MLFFKIFGKLIKILRDGATPAQIAGGFTLGMFLGMMPPFNLYSLVVILLIFLLNVNISASILGWLIFTLFAFFLDPLFHGAGYQLLAQTEWLREFWTVLYNMPVLPLSRYNNTVVLGSFVISILLTAPVFFLSRAGVIQYRKRLDPKIQNLAVVKMMRNNKIYELYQSIKKMGEIR